MLEAIRRDAISDSENFILVSLMFLNGSLLDKFIKTKITNNIKNQDLLKEDQNGCDTNKSCLTKLLEFFKNVSSHINENDPINIYTCIFQKLLRNFIVKGS